MHRLARRLALVIATLLIITACSGADDNESAGAVETGGTDLTATDLPDPCTLIEQAEVDAIFGKTMDPGESRETTGSGGTASGRSCGWGSLSTLSTTIYLSTSYLVPPNVCDWCEPIDGYGDEAWGGITDLGSGGGQLMVIAGDLGVQIDAFGPDVTLEQLGDLANDLIAGLP